MTHPFLRKILFCAACVFAGWITAFAMPPASFWPCLFIGIGGLYWLYAKTRTGPQAFAAGFFFALGYFVTGLWWIGNALLVEGNEFAWVWPISVIGLPTLLALFTGLFLSIARILSAPATLKGFFYFVFFLTVSEWARSYAFTGFPWNLYGYVWADYLPMAQGYFLFGAFGMTLLSVFWAALTGFLLTARPPKKSCAALVGLGLTTALLLFLWGQHRLEKNPTQYDPETAVLVIQPNIEQSMKWDPDVIQDNFLKLNSLSQGAPTDDSAPENLFVVWPETAISPAVYTRQDNLERMKAMLQSHESESYLITGILLRHEKPDTVTYSNSISLLDDRMQVLQTYSKTHLVPFGEFIPFQDWIPLKPVAAFKGFERGQGATVVSPDGAPSYSPLICYEIIFPDKIVPKWQAERPAWIVNVTNDGWYGRSAGPYQHFAQTRIRAIEEGLPVVRSANTGISAVIDPLGRVIEKADIYQEATIQSLLPLKVSKSAPLWPWGFQILVFFTSLALMLSGLVPLIKKKP